MNTSKPTIGIISPAFDSFIHWSHILENFETIITDGYTYHSGFNNGVQVVILDCSIDEVTLALAAFPLKRLSSLTHLVYLGYAGAVNKNINVGDLVLGTRMVTLPNLEGNFSDQKEQCTEISMNTVISGMLHLAAEQVILESTIDPLITYEQELKFGLTAEPSIFRGHVGVGDPFYISPAKRLNALKYDPKLLCLEKEGLMVAMISKQFALPLGMIHIIVQADNDTEPLDYTKFMNNVANRYLAAISSKLIHLLSTLTSVKYQ
jgi:adenosylhomocysteine nucleosidase